MKARKERIEWVEGIHYCRIDPVVNAGYKYEMLCTMIHLGPDALEKTIYERTLSDGATLAVDLCAEAFFAHDCFCNHPYWDDGTPITNWQASREYRKILKRNGHSMRGLIRHYATFLFGGQRIKKAVGWF